MKRRSIGNPLTKNYRPEQGRKRKRLAHHLWQRAPQPTKKPTVRYLRKPWEQSRRPFKQNSDRVPLFAIRLRLQWLRARCALPAARSAGNGFPESWEEF